MCYVIKETCISVHHSFHFLSLQVLCSLHPECEYIFQLARDEQRCLREITELGNLSSFSGRNKPKLLMRCWRGLSSTGRETHAKQHWNYIESKLRPFLRHPASQIFHFRSTFICESQQCLKTALLIAETQTDSAIKVWYLNMNASISQMYSRLNYMSKIWGW